MTGRQLSPISDGAAAVLLMRESDAVAAGLNRWHVSLPMPPTRRSRPGSPPRRSLRCRNCWRNRLGVADVDLFEINEAFAVVTMAAMRDWRFCTIKVNVHGACALGHPIDCLRHAHRGIADLRIAAIWQETWRCQLVYRRREATALGIELIR